MRFFYNILPERRLCLLRFTGSLSHETIATAAETFWADPRYNREFDGIVDMQAITTRMKIRDLKVLLDFLQKPQVGTGRWVAIVATPKITTLTLLFKAALLGPFQFEVVSSREAAYRNLQIVDSQSLEWS